MAIIENMCNEEAHIKAQQCTSINFTIFTKHFIFQYFLMQILSTVKAGASEHKVI
jgi:hypothetical protein